MISSKSSYLTIFAFVLLLPVNETLGQDGNVFRNSGIEVPSATDRPEGVIEVNAIFDGYSVNYINDVVYASYGAVSYTHLTLPKKRIV